MSVCFVLGGAIRGGSAGRRPQDAKSGRRIELGAPVVAVTKASRSRPEERPDPELERAAAEWRKKEQRAEEKKAKREARRIKSDAEEERKAQAAAAAGKKARPASAPSSSSSSSAGNKPRASHGGRRRKRSENPALAVLSDSTASSRRPKRRPVRPEDVVGVRFGGSFTDAVPPTGVPEVALIGRSNVGKSSAINCLAGTRKKLAQTSKQPGRTQQINLFPLSDAKDRDLLTLVDLPGYGYARVAKESQKQIEEFIDEYLSTREELQLILLLVDARREPQQADLDTLRALLSFDRQVLLVCTKVDLAKEVELRRNQEVFREQGGLADDEDLVLFSSVTGQGRPQVWQVIKNVLNRE